MTLHQYHFTPLDSIKIGETCNIFGLVKYCSQPEKTKGKDFKITLSITDLSLGFDFKFMCNLFNEKVENLPRINGRGDVVVIHRLKIGKYQDKPQGLGIQKQGYSVAVFHKSNLFDTNNDSYDAIIKKMGSNINQFNITMEDLNKVQELLEWGYDMPSSELDEIEVNLDSMHFVTLSEISPKMVCSMAFQVVSIISYEYLDYRTLLLVWDGTLPGCDLNKKYVTEIANSTKSKHSPLLMAKLGGKISNPYLGYILLKEESADIEQSFIRPGDFVFISRVSVEMPLIGLGVLLVANESKFGPLTETSNIYQELSARLNDYNGALSCVADCVSSDIDATSTWSLQDFGKLLKQLETIDSQDDSIYQFRITSRVVSVHPSTERDFYQSILLYCTCCQKLHCDQPTIECKRNLVPIPMVTLVFEDFSGWLTGVVVGKSVMDMLNLVMIDVSQPDWWSRLFATKDKDSIVKWIHHVQRLKQGFIEAKLIFKRGAEGKILPFIEDFVILDY